MKKREEEQEEDGIGKGRKRMGLWRRWEERKRREGGGVIKKKRMGEEEEEGIREEKGMGSDAKKGWVVRTREGKGIGLKGRAEREDV